MAARTSYNAHVLHVARSAGQCKRKTHPGLAEALFQGHTKKNKHLQQGRLCIALAVKFFCITTASTCYTVHFSDCSQPPHAANYSISDRPLQHSISAPNAAHCIISDLSLAPTTHHSIPDCSQAPKTIKHNSASTPSGISNFKLVRHPSDPFKNSIEGVLWTFQTFPLTRCRNRIPAVRGLWPYSCFCALRF